MSRIIDFLKRLAEIKKIEQSNAATVQQIITRNNYYVNKLPAALKKTTPEQLEEIRVFWEPYKSLVPNNPMTQVVLSNLSGRFDPSYLPFGLQMFMLRRFWNHASFSTFRNKNFSNLLFPDVKSPRNAVVCNYGIYRDEEGNILTATGAVKKIIAILKTGRELVIKPAMDSGSGAGITFFSSSSTEKFVAQKVNQMAPEFVCQYVLKNHPSFSANEKALNTMRVITLVDGNEIRLVGALWRISNGKKVDNWNAGGIICQVGRDGICGDFAVSGSGERVTEHPNGFQFKGHKLFRAEEVIDTAIRCHKRIAQQKYIAWDFTVDEEGDIVFIEMNSPGGSEGAQSVGLNSYLNRDFAKKIFDNYIYFTKATLKWNYREFSDHVILLEYFGRGKKVVIPEIFKGKKVVTVAGSAFNKTNVRKVVKPSSVPFALAFSSRKNLIEVVDIAKAGYVVQ